ncbi:autotransporter outer membrane beta-barrel domain-containing protein [Phascolarctobacterium succinatutens]|uniref:autotransporter outer membrane beta-barrel domain-containing protein n=1 Tax=Phascolarctobacterium succinatutens TaxID=626940 RepID=UPI0026EAA064|nr:autotransporter outer membrane beta-barrel domain-containing protein [Phascolarctobacterium succinatutens]
MKSSKALARKILCGLLAAGVVGVSGSALAASVNVASGETKSDEAAISIGSGEKFANEGTVNASESITVNNGFFQNAGTVNTKVLDIKGHASDQSAIAGNINATEKFVYRGIAGNLAARKLEAQVNTPLLHILGTTVQTGFKISDEKVLAKVDKVIIEAQNGQRTGLTFDGDMTVNSKIELQGPKGARIEVNSGKTVTFDSIVNKSDKGLIQTNGTGKAIINNLTVETGALNLQTNGDTTTTGEFNLSNVTVGEDAKLYLSVYDKATGDPNTPKAKITGDININLAKDALVDFGAMKEGKPDWDGTRMNVAANSITINAADTSSNAKVYISSNSEITPDKITVNVASANNTGNAEKDLGAAGKIVSFADDSNNNNPHASSPTIKGAENIKVNQEASSIYDAASGVVKVAEDGTTTVTNLKTTKNPFAYGISDNNALSLISWRSEMNDMNKRLGELRDSNGEHGIWVRMVRGEDSYASVHYQYNQYQIGYDEKLSVDKHWTVGAAFTYTDGDTAYSAGSVDNTHKGFAVYGSKLNDDGSFIDLIAEYARLDNDYKTTLGTGDSSTNGYSVSAEYGKRFTKDNGVWIEPQVELSYGQVASTDYTLGGIDVTQEKIDSLVGRLGFALGKDIKQGNIYARASYLYDFDGETAASFNDAGKQRRIEQDLGGGWWEVGFGANINLSKASHLYVDMEKTFGGDINTDWQWNAGVRWSF